MSFTSPDRPDATPEPSHDATAEAHPVTAPEASGEDPAAPEETEGTARTEAPEEHLLVDPTRVRRAPRYRAFLWVGAVVGIVAGLWLGRYLVGAVDPADPETPVLKPGVFVSVTVLGTTTLAMLLAGLVAVLLDRRSLRRSRDR